MSDDSYSARYKISNGIQDYLKEQLSELEEKANAEVVAESVEKKHIIKLILKRIPVFTSLDKNIAGTENLVGQLLCLDNVMPHGQVFPKTSEALTLSSVFASVLDFVRIPAIYLTSYLLGEKVPFKMTKNLQWALAALGLFFAVVVLVVPATAPVVGLVATSLGVIQGFSALGYFFYRKQKLRNELTRLHDAVEYDKKQLEETKTTIKEVRASLETDTGKEFNDYLIVLKDLSDALENDKTALQNHVNQFEFVKSKVQHMNSEKFLDKVVGILIPLLALSGVILSVFIPVLGLAFLFGASIASLCYVLGKLAKPGIEKLAVKLKAEETANTVSEASDSLTEEKRLECTSPHESTADIENLLSRNNKSAKNESEVETKDCYKNLFVKPSDAEAKLQSEPNLNANHLN